MLVENCCHFERIGICYKYHHACCIFLRTSQYFTEWLCICFPSVRLGEAEFEKVSRRTRASTSLGFSISGLGKAKSLHTYLGLATAR